MPSYTIYSNAQARATNSNRGTGQSWATICRETGSDSALDPGANCLIGHGNYVNDLGESWTDIWNGGLRFDTSKVGGVLKSMSISFKHSGTHNGCTAEFRVKSWGVAADCWHPSTGQASLPLFASATIGAAGRLTASSALTSLARSTSFGLSMHSSNHRTESQGVFPSQPTTANTTNGILYHTEITTSAAAGTTDDPYLSIVTALVGNQGIIIA